MTHRAAPGAPTYFECHVSGAEQECGHPQYGEVCVWEGEYTRRPEESNKSEILVLRTRMGTERFECARENLTLLDPATFSPVHDDR